MAAKEVLNDIIQGIQESNLNFSMNLTPFSAYITIRSSFAKNVNLSAISKTFAQTQNVENHPQREESDQFLEKLEILKLLHWNHLQKKNQEILSMKLTLKNKNSELAIHHKEIKVYNKALKEKKEKNTDFVRKLIIFLRSQKV